MFYHISRHLINTLLGCTLYFQLSSCGKTRSPVFDILLCTALTELTEDTSIMGLKCHLYQASNVSFTPKWTRLSFTPLQRIKICTCMRSVIQNFLTWCKLYQMKSLGMKQEEKPLRKRLGLCLHPRPWGPFLESPGNLSGPQSLF